MSSQQSAGGGQLPLYLLSKINSPSDLKKLSPEELNQLSKEIRDVIISTVSKTGGHLAPSLGVVELTIALHYIFDTPKDKIIWDVGHQSYAHKILTGRRDSFHTLRQEGGISGFPKREESEYDCFDVGHSSTSISAALGMAKARDLKGERNKVIAVIGDGSMTAGLAFEGLNQAGHLDTDLLVILNDNEMSISQNVGGLSSYLNRIMTGHFYNKLRKETESFLKHFPKFGIPMLDLARRAEESFKNLIVPGMLFEELGFKYFGPIDGHDIEPLLKMLGNIKNLNEPVLLHVITKKGKGYRPAEERPDEFHGVGSFDVSTGKATKLGGLSYTDIFGETAVELARKDERIIAITAAMPQGTGLERFAREFPHRFFDVGIAEQHAITFAAGLACEGFKPVVAVYSTFMQRSYDQILHDVCLQKLPVILALDRAGIVGADGPTHHGLFDFSYLRHIPNLVLMAPKDGHELEGMLKCAVSWGKPASIRYPRGNVPEVKVKAKVEVEAEIGKGEVLKDGKDLCIVAIGSTAYPALDAAQELEKEGISVAVINARFVKPLDADLITQMAKKTGKIVTVEENVLQGGFGSAVLEMFEERGVTGIKVKRLGIPDRFVEHGGQDTLRKQYGIDRDGIIRVLKEILGYTS